MSSLETVRLLGIAAREWCRLGADAVSSSALPYKADDVATPATLTRLLNDWPLDSQRAPAQVIGLSRQDIPSVSSNCHNLVLSIEQEGEATLPDSLFVKLPMESAVTRWFFSIINSWRLESHFFRHVARDLPLRTPVTFATGFSGTRFFLIQENLHEDPSVRLFTNPEMMEGPSLDLVRRCLDTFARLHSVHHGQGAAERERILPLDYHPMLSPTMGSLSKTLNRLALGPCKKKCPGVLPADIEDAYRLTLQHWPRLLDEWYSGPLSLLHGDSHLGNFFVSGEDMGMLDWQAAHWGKGTRDVHYFLTDSLPADVLAAHEQELLDYYVERRAHHGAPIDRDQAWWEYRGFAYHTLMTIVVSIGFGALNEEQDALMAEILRRSVASAQRLDYVGWLDTLLSRA